MKLSYMPLYVADYLADTPHLNAAQHGAYLLLIMHLWRVGALPQGDDQLARIARMTPREWQSARPVLEPLFMPGWRHKRVEAEREKALCKSRSRSQSGVRGGEAKSLKYKNAVLANARILPQQKDDFAMASSSDVSSLRSETDNPSLRSGLRHQPEKPHPAKPVEASPRQVLEAVLTAQTAADVIAHRQRLRKPLTTRAAQEMVKNFNATGDPEGAAALMIEHGWLTVKVEWYRNANGKRSETRPGNGSALGNALREIAGGPLFAPREHAERVSSTGWDDDFSGTTIDHDPGGESA